MRAGDFRPGRKTVPAAHHVHAGEKHIRKGSHRLPNGGGNRLHTFFPGAEMGPAEQYPAVSGHINRHMTAQVPWGATALAKTGGESSVDSIWMCPSMSPGHR